MILTLTLAKLGCRVDECPHSNLASHLKFIPLPWEIAYDSGDSLLKLGANSFRVSNRGDTALHFVP